MADINYGPHPENTFCEVKFECVHGVRVCKHVFCPACKISLDMTYAKNTAPWHSWFTLRFRKKRGNAALRRIARKLGKPSGYMRDNHVESVEGTFTDDGSLESRMPSRTDYASRIMHGAWSDRPPVVPNSAEIDKWIKDKLDEGKEVHLTRDVYPDGSVGDIKKEAT